MQSCRLGWMVVLTMGMAGCGEHAPQPAEPTPLNPVTTEPAVAALTQHGAEPLLADLVLVRHTWSEPHAMRLVDTAVPDAWAPVFFEAKLDPSVTPTGAVSMVDQDQAGLERTAQWWCGGAAARWNEIARHMIIQQGLNSSVSARLFAALSVAQHDALLLARRASLAGPPSAPDAQRLAERGCGLVEQHNAVDREAAVGFASARVLAALVPATARFVMQNEAAQQASREWTGSATRAELEAGRAVGEQVAQALIVRMDADGTRNSTLGSVPRQAGKWFSEHQTLPNWSKVRPWVMESGSQFRAPVPPALESGEFRAALAEIREFSDKRSAEQLAIANFWNLGVGGISVPGMWNEVALDYAQAARFSEMQTARLLAAMNMAIMDATIACWDSKYFYLVPRPSMMDPQITEPLGLPPHPSYPSGHSAISGAASGTLAAAFPADAEQIRRMAQEASASRFYGGIHYRFDGDAGLQQGRSVAQLVMSRYPLLAEGDTQP